MIIIINASGGRGKDTFVSKFTKYCSQIYNLSTIDIIREVAKKLGCVNKEEKDRAFLSDLKDLSTKYYEHPKNYITTKVKQIQSKYAYKYVPIIFVHSREPEEIKWFQENLENCKSLLIRNSNVPLIETNHADKNVEN